MAMGLIERLIEEPASKPCARSRTHDGRTMSANTSTTRRTGLPGLATARRTMRRLKEEIVCLTPLHLECRLMRQRGYCVVLGRLGI
jgi:hypothetical protein